MSLVNRASLYAMLAIEPTMRYGTRNRSKKSAAFCINSYGLSSAPGKFGGSMAQAACGLSIDLLVLPFRVLLSDCSASDYPGGFPHAKCGPQTFCGRELSQHFHNLRVENFYYGPSARHVLSSVESSSATCLLETRWTSVFFILPALKQPLAQCRRRDF